MAQLAFQIPDKAVVPFGKPAIDNVIPLLELFNQLKCLRWMSLEIIVHAQYVVSVRIVHPGEDGVMLPAVFRQIDSCNKREFLRKPLYLVKRRVLRTVVYKDKFIGILIMLIQFQCRLLNDAGN